MQSQTEVPPQTEGVVVLKNRKENWKLLEIKNNWKLKLQNVKSSHPVIIAVGEVLISFSDAMSQHTVDMRSVYSGLAI